MAEWMLPTADDGCNGSAVLARRRGGRCRAHAAKGDVTKAEGGKGRKGGKMPTETAAAAAIVVKPATLALCRN